MCSRTFFPPFLELYSTNTNGIQFDFFLLRLIKSSEDVTVEARSWRINFNQIVHISIRCDMMLATNIKHAITCYHMLESWDKPSLDDPPGSKANKKVKSKEIQRRGPLLR